ncbi:PepSY domain-containing protein [Acidicapsa ligni]|uniref:PepSY domain-containing protein n=1 Tax=Acidicapsa ligni TaxID=542300 RepID=UPI0021E0A6E2|nr:PepSY domain-containing protein [Acidicapsa ligni]
MSRSHAVLRFLRKVHLYIGIFIAPALLFFAFTGAMQTFSLHETTQGSDYKPPAWIVTLGQLHKKQTTVIPVRKPKPAANEKPAAGPQGQKTSSAPVKSHLPMKIFFLLVSIGLFISTLTGVYMSYKYQHNKLLVTGLLLAGIVVPLVLLPF